MLYNNIQDIENLVLDTEVNDNWLLPDECYFSRRYKKPLILKPDGIITHYISNKWENPTDPYIVEEMINILIREKNSYHFLIDRNGILYNLMPLTYQAWHAGLSRLNGRNNCNAWTFGISLLNNGKDHYEIEQIKSYLLLCLWLMNKYNIKIENISGHDIVRYNWRKEYPGSITKYGKKSKIKYDPGSKFDWEYIRHELSVRS